MKNSSLVSTLSDIAKRLFWLLIFLPTVAVGFLDSEIEIKPAGSGEFQFTIRFPTRENLSYELVASKDLKDWIPLGEALVGDGTMRSFAATTSVSARFFRVREVIADAILSQITGIEYPFRVYLPPSYQSSDKLYPVIYSTDAEWLFEDFRAAIIEQRKEVILVGIDEGPLDRRWVDYTSPGSTDYYQFLTTEFLPMFESACRVDPEQRAICGASLGGLLTGLILLMEDPETPYFKNYLSFDGSFWWDNNFLNQLEQSRFEASSEMNASLVLTSALGAFNNDGVVSAFKSKLDARNYTGLTIYRRSYAVDHGDIGKPSFSETLELLY